MLAAFLRALFFYILSSPCSAGTIFSRFIVTARRGNNIFAVLSSPCGAGTIFLCFIVAVRRGNNIFAFHRRRAARKQYFRVSVLAALLRALKLLFSSLQNGGTCWNGRGGAYVPARTSAQRRFHPKMRRFHPKMRCCHPQMLRFHLRKACFHV